MTEAHERSNIVQALLKRFGGLEETQPFRMEDGTVFHLDNTVSGTIIFSHPIVLTPNITMEHITISHGLDFEDSINTVMASMTRPVETEPPTKFKVNLNPDVDARADFELAELKKLFIDLEAKGFKVSQCTRNMEDAGGGDVKKVDIMMFLDYQDSKTVLVSATVLAPFEQAIVLCMMNVRDQLTPLLQW